LHNLSRILYLPSLSFFTFPFLFSLSLILPLLFPLLLAVSLLLSSYVSTQQLAASPLLHYIVLWSREESGLEPLKLGVAYRTQRRILKYWYSGQLGALMSTETPLCLTLISLMTTHESQACCLYYSNKTAVVTIRHSRVEHLPLDRVHVIS
jgi:hypothetical protein